MLMLHHFDFRELVVSFYYIFVPLVLILIQFAQNRNQYA